MATDPNDAMVVYEQSVTEDACDADGVSAKSDNERKTNASFRTTLCGLSSALVFVAGLAHSFGLIDMLTDIFSRHPLESLYCTGMLTALFFTIFPFSARIAKIALGVLFFGGLIVLAIVLSCLSWMAWFVFFTSGMNLSGEFPLVISKLGAALILLSVTMGSSCLSFRHRRDDETVTECLLFAFVVANVIAGLLIHFVTSVSDPASYA